MSMIAPISNMLCRHEFYWSERHHASRCRRCGSLRPADAPDAAVATNGDASTDSAIVFERLEPTDWRRPRVELAPSEDAGPRVDAAALRRQAEARRAALLDLLTALESGRSLELDEALDLAMALVEDGHSADPQVFGLQAAEYFERLHARRWGEETGAG